MTTRAAVVPLPRPGSGLHRAWEELAALAVEPSVFAEPAFVLAAAGALEEGADVRLLVARDRAGLALALPVRTLAAYKRVPVPAGVSWQHDYSYLGTPLVRPDATRTAWEALLRDPPPAWQWLVLGGLPLEGRVWDGLEAALHGRGVTPTRFRPQDRAVVLRRPQATYLDGRLRGVHRKGLRRQRRLLGQEVVTRERRGDPGAVEDFLALEASGWKGRAGTAMAARARHGELLRELVRTDPDVCQVFSLEVDGRPVAVQVDLRRGRTAWCFKTAYDERLRASSPGLLLMLDVIEPFHDDDGLDVLDSCAVPGHPMADRIMPDRRPLATLLVPLRPPGRLAARADALLADLKSRLSPTTPASPDPLTAPTPLPPEGPA